MNSTLEWDSFVYHPTFYAQIETIKDDNLKLRLYQAIAEYGGGDILPDFSDIDPLGILDALFQQFKFAIDGAKAKRKYIRNVRSEAGKLGGAPTGNSNAKQAKQAKQAKTSVNVNDNVNDNVNKKEKVEKVEKENTPPSTLSGDVYAGQVGESSAFDKLFGEISAMLLGHAGDIWRVEMSKTHGVTDFEKAFAQFRSYLIQNALERNIQSQSDFRRYFNWRAKEFLTDEAKKAPVKYFARIEKLSDTHWVVHQYGGIDPIPVGTPDPPSPYHVWTGTQWEHA